LELEAVQSFDLANVARASALKSAVLLLRRLVIS
jgi:hypothetical protein